MQKKICTSIFVSALLIIGTCAMIQGCLDIRPDIKPEIKTNGPSIAPSSIPQSIQDAMGKLDKLPSQSDLTTSQNAIQQNLQSAVALGIGKIADDLVKINVGLKDMIHAEMTTNIGEIKNSLNASVASNNELRVMLKAQMDINANLQADIRATITTQAEIKAEIEAKVNALVAGQAGIGNKLTSSVEEMKQNLSAGHDVNNSTVQFNEHMLAALKSANETTVDTNGFYAKILLALISAAATIVGLILRSSRQRSEIRAKEAQAELKIKSERLEKALSLVPPHQRAELFPDQKATLNHIPNSFLIIVNGCQKTTLKKFLSKCDIVKLAYPNVPEGDIDSYTISYESVKSCGTVVSAQIVPVVDRMIFNVVMTNNA